MFDCGNSVIDRWFKNDAKKYSDRSEIRVFTAHIPDYLQAVGFYALQIGSESTAEMDRRPDDYTKSRTAFPAIHLAYFGVDHRFQRRKIGTQMISDMIDRVYRVSCNVGMYALTLQSIGPQATDFYGSIGFEIYKQDAQNPKMLLPIRTIIRLVEDR